jgi:hypothetical protein
VGKQQVSVAVEIHGVRELGFKRLDRLLSYAG